MLTPTVPCCCVISMAFMMALTCVVTICIAICPLVTVTGNVRSTALPGAPAETMMLKFVRTMVPLR